LRDGLAVWIEMMQGWPCGVFSPFQMVGQLISGDVEPGKTTGYLGIKIKTEI
jgi:hypothetical protein